MAEKSISPPAVFSAMAGWGRAASETLADWRAALVEKLREYADAPAKIAPVAAVAALVGVLFWTATRFVRRLVVRGVRRADETDPRVRRVRERAGRALARIDREGLAGRPVDESVRSAVESIRFGAPATWPEPVATLDAVSPALRRARKGGGT